MKPLRCLFAAALMVCLIPALSAAQAKETETVHKVVPLPAGGTLELHNFSGDVRITGADVAEVTIDAVRRATRDRLDHIKLDIQSSGSTVAVQANKKDEGWDGKKDNVVETEFTIQVPRTANLKLDVFSSDVVVRQVSGQQSIKTFSGDATIEDGNAPIHVKTFSGDVTARLAVGAARPDLDLETFSGGIEVKVAEGARAALAFDSFSGSLTSDWPLTVHEQKKGKLRGDLNGGDAAHNVRFKTFSGNVKLVK
jgi:DUF4097 and DUF4098 domain-containing protein YvlB